MSTGSKAAWRWKEEQQAARPADYRRAGMIQAAVIGGVAVILGLLGRVLFAWIAGGIAAVLLVIVLVRPRWYAPIRGFSARLGRWAAAGLTWGLLTPFFYLVFVPGRIVLALRGRDPLEREFPTDKPTYWVAHPPRQGTQQYRKQYT